MTSSSRKSTMEVHTYAEGEAEAEGDEIKIPREYLGWRKTKSGTYQALMMPCWRISSGLVLWLAEVRARSSGGGSTGKWSGMNGLSSTIFRPLYRSGLEGSGWPSNEDWARSRMKAGS